MADYYKESAENKIKRMLIVERVRDLVQGGNAGFIPRLGVVDRREYPNAMSLPFSGKRAYSPRGKKSN